MLRRQNAIAGTCVYPARRKPAVAGTRAESAAERRLLLRGQKIDRRLFELPRRHCAHMVPPGDSHQP